MAQQTNQQLKAERKNLINEILADNLHGKKIYLRNKNNINEFENKKDIYIQIYKLLFDRIYKKTQNT